MTPDNMPFAEVLKRLRHAVTTASNDDVSEAGTTARKRHVERLDAMLVAAEHIEKLEEALDRIAQWTQAYPLSVFPEPDWKRARALLEASGMTLDSVSAGAMRRVVDGIAGIIAEVRPQ